MAQAPTGYLYSAEDLLEMEDGDSYELDDGELVEVPVGAKSQWVAGELLRRLGNFLERNPIGLVLPAEVGLQIFPDRPHRIPRPDGGFISFERLPNRHMPDGFLTVAPELLIEAISPGEKAGYLLRKKDEYLDAGVRLVWLLRPDTRSAEVHRADGTGISIHTGGYLDGEDVIPGFRCALADIMPQVEDDAIDD